MKLNELYQKEKLLHEPLKVFRVKSKTNFNPDTGEPVEYSVELWNEEEMFCNCLWGQFRKKKKPCYHIEEIKNELIKKYGSLIEAVNCIKQKNKNEKK